MELGIDRILFLVDYSFVDNLPAKDWIPNILVCAEDKVELLSVDAERLLSLERSP